ncbi:Hypothetical predicted protein [Mytilus galloprovincialis]|uniref:Uncharacterized protein n=1 Tax=Mytilus galloprovincialis TaxID=29158 RepID=A0A8B6CZS7_MYTGA|nr:Hypothetical predicted protein [Mytilus galloprovincialis]
MKSYFFIFRFQYVKYIKEYSNFIEEHCSALVLYTRVFIQDYFNKPIEPTQVFITPNLYIVCHRPICGRLIKIKLGKTHYPGENKRVIGVFDVNTKIATEENGDTQTGISVSTDTCWQKKGSGRSYNSCQGMEPDMVVEMLKGLDDKDIVISQVVGDDDSTGF